MLSSSKLTDLSNLGDLRSALSTLDPEQRLLPLDILKIEISNDAHLHVAQAVHEALINSGKNLSDPKVNIITDKTPIRRDGALLSEVVERQLTKKFITKMICLDDGHEKLHADETVLDTASAATKDCDVIVTIGSGTITDIGKIAALRNGDLPHVVVQTAASVDGFTDNVSVVLQNGVKRTVPSRWPSVVLADVVTIGTAPHEMNVAGLGEAISLFTAPADWYLSFLLGLDKTFHPASLTMLQSTAAEPPNWAIGIANGEAEAVTELTRLLALRGIVSGVSNTTACLSGVEHVISHMLDLHNAALNKPIGLHGAQVGVASLVASKLWREVIDTKIIQPELLRKPDVKKIEARINSAFSHLGKSIVEECWRDAQKKHKSIIDNWENFERLINSWPQKAHEFEKLVTPSNTLRSALKMSGAPSSFQSLNPSISIDITRWAVQNCFLMRNRFNLIDLLDLLGLWTEERISWALSDTLEGKSK